MMHNARMNAQRGLLRSIQTSNTPQSTFNVHIQSILTATSSTTQITPVPFRSLSSMTHKQQQKYVHNLNQSMKLSKFASSQRLKQQSKNLSSLMHTVPQASLKGNSLRAITVALAAEQYEEASQQKRDFSFFSPEIQQFHDQIVTRRLPFNSSTDLEFTLKDLKTTTIWTSNSLVGLIKAIIYAPWEAIQFIWSTGIKVYLRFTNKFDRILTPWVYKLLDLKVPLEDLIFDIKQFSPEEHQLYSLITQILRYQLVVELALKESIQSAPFPEEYIQQQAEKAQQLGMSEEEFQKQLESSVQAFQKQKVRALKHLQLIGIPEEFSPDAALIELIQNFEFSEDFPLEQIIIDPRGGLEVIRRFVSEQLAQIPMPQMATLLEFKGLSQALRSLQQPEHFAEYRRLFTFVSSPDMTLRRQLRSVSLQGTSKDYDRIRTTVMKQIQHIRRVVKTYKRQQQQVKEFGFIVKRRNNFNPNDPKLSRLDRAMFFQDVQDGTFASIEDVDPQEEAEGSLIDNGEVFNDPHWNNRNDNSSNDRRNMANADNERMLARRDRSNQRRVRDVRPLTEQDIVITLRVLALTARRDQDPDFEIDDESLSDPSNDEELLDTALNQFNGDVTALEQELRPIFHDIRREMMDGDENENGDDNYDDQNDYDDQDDYDNEYYQDDEMPGDRRRQSYRNNDPANGLDPLHDDEFDDERYLGEHLSPLKNNKDRQRGEKTKGGKRALPAHVVRDPNPKVVSYKWFSEALQHYEGYQDRLRYIERLIMERDFRQKDKYLAATRHFSTALLDETAERTRSVKLQSELQLHIKKMFEALPEDARKQYFQQRYEFEHKISHLPPEQQQLLKQQQKEQQNESSPLFSPQDGASAGQLNDLPDLTALVTPAATSVPTQIAEIDQKLKIDLANIPMEFPTPKSRQDELEQANDMLQVIQAVQLQTHRHQYAMQELERAHQREEMRIVGRNEDILQRANAQQRQKVEDARLLVAKQRLDRQRAITQAEAEGKPIPEFPPIASLKDQIEAVNQGDQNDELEAELQRVQDEISKIDIKLSPSMSERALQKAVQHTELPLLQQLSLLRMKSISNVELFNSEMLDIMFNSMRDFLQTTLYDANQHNVLEHSVSALMLTVLNSPKSIESYDDMTRFNERVEEQVNKPRAVVNKLTTLQRKWLLMSLQQEYQLNQFYPIGQLPPIIPFLTNPAREAKMARAQSENDIILMHEDEFRSIPLTRTKILDHIKVDLCFGDDSTSTAIRNASQDLPLFLSDIQLQDQVGEYFLSQQADKFIVSPSEITMDLFDARFDIVNQKHLLNQLKRVRDRRLRELLQLIGMIGTDSQVLASTTKFHIKQLEPAFAICAIPENLVVYLTKYYTHRSIATTLEEMIRVLSQMRQQVSEKTLDFSLNEYDITLQYCMDLYQYHIKQLQIQVPDFYSAQFRAVDLSIVGFENVQKPWRPEFQRPLSLKELNTAAYGDDTSDI